MCLFGAAGWTGRAVLRSLLECEEVSAVRAFDLHEGTWEGSRAIDGGSVQRLLLRHHIVAWWQ